MIDSKELSAIRSYVTEALARKKPVSKQYLLNILSSLPVNISRDLGGLPLDLRGRIHFGDPERAASSLLDMRDEYVDARDREDPRRMEDCRRAVRQAKNRLKMILRRPALSPEKRGEKEELLQWFLIWLETPALFDQWLALRRRAEGGSSP